MAVWKVLFKSGGILTQAADALIWPDEAGYGSDVVRPVDEAVGDAGYLRKLQVVFTRTPSGSVEDVAVCTFDFARIVGDEASTAWVTGDYTAAETAFNTWWTAIKPLYLSTTKLYAYRWYKSGPAYPISGPPVRVTLPNSPGTSSGTLQLPPQCSINVSEHTRLRKHWGRYYLPAPDSTRLTSAGRVDNTTINLISTQGTTLYNSLRTSGVVPVVYSKAKPARQTRAGTTLPPQAARAYVVEQLVVDDIYDVIRSRRYDRDISRITTTLT